MKIIKGARKFPLFARLGDTYFARDEKRIYAYGKAASQGGSALMGIAQSLVFPRCRRVYLPSTGRSRGRIGTVSPYAPPLEHLHLLTTCP